MKPSISKKSKYHQGIFVPVHPEKYVGKSQISYRSSWELRLMKWLDNHQSIICWNSEDFIVKYVSPIDNRQHKYYIDFVAKMKLRDGSEKTYAIEVKPLKEMLPPSNKIKNKQRLLTETTTYIVNQAKWTTAKEYCMKIGIEFIVLNENDLGIS